MRLEHLVIPESEEILKKWWGHLRMTQKLDWRDSHWPYLGQFEHQNKWWGTSLVVQWLGIRLPMQGTWVRALVREDPTCLEATKPMCHNYWACSLEPASHNYWAHMPQLQKPTHLEPVLCNKRSHRSEKPAHRNEESPPLASTRESLRAAMKTQCSRK